MKMRKEKDSLGEKEIPADDKPVDAEYTEVPKDDEQK